MILLDVAPLWVPYAFFCGRFYNNCWNFRRIDFRCGKTYKKSSFKKQGGIKMYLLDVAVGPMYAAIGGTFLLIIAVTAGIVFGAIKLIELAVRKNKEDKK